MSFFLICIEGILIKIIFYYKKYWLYFLYPFLLSVPASLLDFKPDDDEYESISIFLAGKLVIDDDEVSVLETHGFVRILQRCLGEGAKNWISEFHIQ